ncbi:MAG: transposase [Desulfobacterales bacterium]
MPRQSRIDAPGALHHVIARGIGRRNIFNDDIDRDNFIRRLQTVLEQTRTGCYAWALIPNHFHLLLRTGDVPVATTMRRLLTGHGATFNLRHRRNGHLFQNRYKSILCQEETYLLELVRYIHLNPLRAKLVKNLSELETFPYSGHRELMGKGRRPWQDTAFVLNRFGRTTKAARRKYGEFITKGISAGQRPDLIGGGLVRSMGGWSAVKALRKAKIYMKGDERILGDSDFVEQVLEQSQETYEQNQALQAQGIDTNAVARHVAKLLDIDIDLVWSRGKNRTIVKARSLFCYWLAGDLGISMSDLARQLGLSVTAISQSVERGKRIAAENDFSLKNLKL